MSNDWRQPFNKKNTHESYTILESRCYTFEFIIYRTKKALFFLEQLHLGEN